MAAHSVPPNQSLYVQNLPERFQKEDLRRQLYMLFSTYGPVLDVTALKTAKMRGQAHVLFRDVQSATQALRSCQGFEVGGREIKISYAKHRSNTLAKLTGTTGQPAPATGAASRQALMAQPPSSFPAPPGTLPAPPSGLPPPPGTLPSKFNGAAFGGLKATEKGVEDMSSPQGVKRLREDSDEASDAAMEEDEDEDEEGGEMEMSDED